MNENRFKSYHFFLCWLLALSISVLITLPILGLIAAFIIAFIARLSSFPFIVIFVCILSSILHRMPPKQRLHLYTFVAHLVGSMLVLVGFWFFDKLNLVVGILNLALVMLGYFVTDSALFHLTIEKRYCSDHA